MNSVERRRRGSRIAALIVLAMTVVAACSGLTGASSASPAAQPSGVGPARGIGGRATAGPVCPVERFPPDPSCAARPVVGAVIVIQDEAGAEVARTTTERDGTYFIQLPAGTYAVVPQPATGLMGTPAPQTVTVEFVTELDLSYDTGIR